MFVFSGLLIVKWWKCVLLVSWKTNHLYCLYANISPVPQRNVQVIIFRQQSGRISQHSFAISGFRVNMRMCRDIHGQHRTYSKTWATSDSRSFLSAAIQRFPHCLSSHVHLVDYNFNVSDFLLCYSSTMAPTAASQCALTWKWCPMTGHRFYHPLQITRTLTLICKPPLTSSIVHHSHNLKSKYIFSILISRSNCLRFLCLVWKKIITQKWTWRRPQFFNMIRIAIEHHRFGCDHIKFNMLLTSNV